MKRSLFFTLVLALAVGCMDHQGVTAPEIGPEGGPVFTMVVLDLKALPGLEAGSRAEARDINAHGLMAGFARRDGESRPVLWEGGGILELSGIGPGGGFAWAVNNRRQVVGQGDISTGAFLWENSITYTLPTLVGYESGSTSARGINDLGQIVGWAYEATATPQRQAVLWDGGSAVGLGVPPGATESEARALNASGRIVGTSTDSDGVWVATLWENGSAVALPGQGEYGSSANDINELGHIAGWTYPVAHPLSVLWIDGEMIPLDIPDEFVNEAMGINNHGQVAGYAQDQITGGSWGYLWMDGRYYPLPGLGGGQARASSINDEGQVSGYARDTNGVDRPVIWQVPIRAHVEVEPGSSGVKLNGGGKVTVVIRGTPWFNAASIDPASLTLGDESGTDTPVLRNRNGRVDARLVDEDRDGHLDLVVAFDRRALVQSGDLHSETEFLVLLGKRTDGKQIRGVGAVTVQP